MEYAFTLGDVPTGSCTAHQVAILRSSPFAFFYFHPGMADWAPVLVGVVLFVLLSPGLLFSLPGHHRTLDFGGMKTNGKAIAVHTLIFFAAYTILILAVNLHITTG
ncbi:hypothetical protein YC2023_053756 [Brassica napus]